MVALEALRIPAEEVIQDAVKRDKALTQFERIEERRLRELEQKKSEENKRLQEEMERIFNEIREKMEDNNSMLKEARERFQAWQQEKEKEEQRLSSVLQYFVSQEIPDQAHVTKRRRSSDN
jgi:predicted glutamine amidotransferase